LVLFSAGQDSATCLAWALARFERVETVAFDYGQRHAIELAVRRDFLDRVPRIDAAWGRRLGADHILDFGVLGEISDTALTRGVAIAPGPTGLPNTFVPGQDLMFVTSAAALTWRRGLGVIVGGMCEADLFGLSRLPQRCAADAGGSDPAQHGCRHPARNALDVARQGGDRLVEAIVDDTHTCYLGERGSRQAWGHGCGTCPTCDLRRTGWETWQRTVTDC
jgi:7-cyano-7-deazaguanine synthase